MTKPLIAAASALTPLSPFVALAVGAARPDDPMSVMLPPWMDADRVIAAGGGLRIGPVSTPLASLAHSDDPALAATLRSLGALSCGTQPVWPKSAEHHDA